MESPLLLSGLRLGEVTFSDGACSAVNLAIEGLLPDWDTPAKPTIYHCCVQRTSHEQHAAGSCPARLQGDVNFGCYYSPALMPTQLWTNPVCYGTDEEGKECYRQ